MVTYISFLRGINVGGQKRVGMGELKELFLSLGFESVQTYLQSGNVLFEHPDADVDGVKDKIEKKISRSFGFDVLVFIRTRDEIQKLIEGTPFAGLDPSKLHVTFLSERPANFPADEIERVKDAAERFSGSDREIYLFCPNGYGRTKLSNGFFERKLKVDATTRNWRTLNALLSMA